MKKLTPKRPKIQCEVCGETDSSILERHHIIERTDLNCTNDDYNLAVLCPSCHTKLHSGRLRIIGVYPGTRPPTGRILIYELDGVKNLDLDESYFTPQPVSMKVPYDRCEQADQRNGGEREGSQSERYEGSSVQSELIGGSKKNGM